MALERERKIDIYIESGGYKKRQTYKKEMDRQRDSRTCVAKRSHQAKISPRPYNRYTLTYTYIHTCLKKGGAEAVWVWRGRGTGGGRSRDARVSCQKQRRWRRQTQSAKKCYPNYQSETFVK